MPAPTPPDAMTVLVTANEAYPAFESLFLTAQSHINLGFRIFDPMTKLYSEAAKRVGDSWVDLIVHTLNRGVAVSITLSDFDPIAGYDLHRDAWSTVRILHALNEMTTPDAAVLHVRCLLHPAQGGVLSRMIFAPQTRKNLRDIAADINGLSGTEPQFKFIPRLRDALKLTDGKVALRPALLPKIYPVTLHQKMAIVDDHTTYIGGLDLNERRYDDQSHDQPAQETWHDVQLIIRDSALARDANAFLRTLPQTTAGTRKPPPISSGFRTTLSRRRKSNSFALAPDTISDGLLQAHLSSIRAARSFIYIETQYFRDRRIANALASAGRRNPNLKLLLLLPAAPEIVAFDGGTGLDARYGEYLQTRAFRRVRRAFGQRFFAISPVQPRAKTAADSDMERASLKGAPIIYVHAKVAIFDDISAIVGSANLNGRSMKWDVETGVVLTNSQQVETLRDKVFRHWLPDGAAASYFAPQTAFDSWRQLATSNAKQPPHARDGFIMPYDLDPAKSLAMPVPGAPEELI